MATTIDNMVVEAQFNNGQLLAGVRQTLEALKSLEKGLALTGAHKGLEGVGKAAADTPRHFLGIRSALDTMRSALHLPGANKGLLDVQKAATDTPRSFLGITSAMTGVRNALHLPGATKGFTDVQGAARATPSALGGISAATGQVAASFTSMQVVAGAALATLVSQAVQAGQRVVSGMTSPIRDGFTEYETKMKSIQTILANTQIHGTSLETVNHELEVLNQYADKTIYNFSEMTKNASLFTNSGLKIEEATAVIKGFSNAAAASGTNSNDAARAALQLTQGFSKGKITLEEWRSLTNAGMGNANMKRGILDIAQAMGTLEKSGTSSEAVQKDFNLSLQNGWLTADVMSTYLQAMTGDMTDSELAAKGLGAEQIKALQQSADTAFDAATKVRTFTQLMSTMKEAVASGWTSSFEILFGDFNEATKLFSGVSDTIGGMLAKSGEARNKLLGDFKALGGRDLIIQGLKNAFVALGQVLKPIKDAFREIFPKKTAADLVAMATSFRDFTESLKIGESTAANLKSTFAGVFAIFSIVGQVIGGAISAIGKLFGVIGQGSGGFLNFTGGVGEFLVALDAMLKKSGLVTAFFDGLGKVLAIPLGILKGLGGIISGLFSGFDGGAAETMANAFDNVGKRLDPLQSGVKRLQGFFEKVGEVAGKVGKVISKALSTVGQAIADAFSSENFNTVLDTINTGLLAGIIILLKGFFTGSLGKIDFTGGLFDSVKDTLGEVTGTLKTMQTQIKADIILKIAAALALLTASIVVLSLIDSDKLSMAMTGLAIGFTGLSVAMVGLSKLVSYAGTLKLPFLTASLVLLAGAMLALAVALKIMASIEADEMNRALFGLGASLTIIAVAMRLMPKNMVAQAAALLLLGVALNALAVALKQFAGISWDEMGTGMAALAGSLVILAVGMRLMPTNMLLQAVALTILAVALNGMAVALKVFATMSLGEIGASLLTLAGALVIIAAAMALMPPNMLIQAVALNAVAVALNVLALALNAMGGQSWEEIGKGLVTLAGALVILAAGLTLMSGTLAGAAALVVAAGALAILTPILIVLGTLSWETIIKGMTALALVFAVIGVAGLLLTPIVPTLIGLAGAFLLMGASLVLMGASAIAFATAFTTVVSIGAAGVEILGKILKTLIDSIPQALAAFGQGIVNLAAVIGRGGAAFFSAFSTILKSILRAIITNAPLIGQAMLTLLATLLRIVVTAAPMIAAAGLQLIVRMLAVMSANVGRIVVVASQLIINFLNALNSQMPALAAAGARTVIAFVNAVAGAIRANSGAMGAAGANLGLAIVQGIGGAIRGGLSIVTSAARGLASSALSAAKSALGINSPSKEFQKIGEYVNQGFVKGLNGTKATVQAAYEQGLAILAAGKKAAREDYDAAMKQIAKLREAQKRNVAAAGAVDRKSKGAAEKLRQLTVARQNNVKAIAAETAKMKTANTEFWRTSSAYTALAKTLNPHTRLLLTYGQRLEDVTKKVEAQTKVYEDAVKVRDDYGKSVKDQFSGLPDISRGTKLTRFVVELEKKIKDTQNFTTAVQALRGLGLNDQVYKELISKGVDALPFAQQILTGGKASVDKLNTLGSELNLSASKLGNDASTNLYQAGVNAAQGLLKGLQSQQKAIDDQMAKVAAKMVQVLKAKLGIKSPSREFAKLGVWSVEGLAKGLNGATGVSKRAAEGVGTDALAAIKKSLTGLSGALDGDLDLSPTITPVLDMSGVVRDSQVLGSLLSTKPISVEAAFTKAKTIAKGYEDNRAASFEIADEANSGTTLNYTQVNNSPKALSNAEIYRGTSNQLSVAKRKLGGTP